MASGCKTQKLIIWTVLENSIINSMTREATVATMERGFTSTPSRLPMKNWYFFRYSGLGMTMLEMPRPAMLKVFVGAVQIIMRSRYSGATTSSG